MSLRNIVFCLVLAAGLGVVFLINMPDKNAAASATWTKDQALSHVTETQDVGSGYRDLEGLTLAYNYVGFGSFELAFYDNRLKWRGFGDGFFDKIVSQVNPTVSKVAENVYFLSWNTPGGTDNVVVNFDLGTVHAHLWSGTGSVDDYSDFDQIHGEILCAPSKDCAFPEGAPTGMFGKLYRFILNSWKYDLPSLTEFQPPLVSSHADGLAELTGRTLRYVGDAGGADHSTCRNFVTISSGFGRLLAMCFLRFLNIAEDHFSGGRPKARAVLLRLFPVQNGDHVVNLCILRDTRFRYSAREASVELSIR